MLTARPFVSRQPLYVWSTARQPGVQSNLGTSSTASRAPAMGSTPSCSVPPPTHQFCHCIAVQAATEPPSPQAPQATTYKRRISTELLRAVRDAVGPPQPQHTPPCDRRVLLVIRSSCKFASLMPQDLAGCLVRWPLIAPPVLLGAVEGRHQLLPHGLRHAAVQVLGVELLDVRRAAREQQVLQDVLLQARLLLGRCGPVAARRGLHGRLRDRPRHRRTSGPAAACPCSLQAPPVGKAARYIGAVSKRCRGGHLAGVTSQMCNLECTINC